MRVGFRIHIGRCQHRHDALALLQPNTTKLNIPSHDAWLGKLYRRHETQELLDRYRETALAVLQKCLPVRPTPEFGAIVHDTVLHLRLVNGAPFPSRNLGPWMTVFSRPNRGG
jgi:hypothetical protein